MKDLLARLLGRTKQMDVVNGQLYQTASVNTGKRRHEPMFVRGGTQRAKIIAAMCRGEWTGAYDACQITNSHKGETRFGDVIRLFRRAGVDTIYREMKAKSGETFKQYQILPSHREAARKLIRKAV